MALPKIDAPVYELDLPLSGNHVRFRPFLVKEQRNLLMALESDDKETIEKNVRQVLHNCTLTENIDIDSLPILDVEYYFLQLRARSVGEVVDNKYRCENVVNDKKCGNLMETSINLLDIQIEKDDSISDIVEINDSISIKLKYPEFSVLQTVAHFDNSADIAFQMIIESIDYIFDGQQYYYAKETTQEELTEFIESLNQDQFSRIERFFENLPKLNKTINMTCSKCGYAHTIEVEGLENFFG
jgi:T4 bacteriophage base plate protein